MLTLTIYWWPIIPHITEFDLSAAAKWDASGPVNLPPTLCHCGYLVSNTHGTWQIAMTQWGPFSLPPGAQQHILLGCEGGNLLSAHFSAHHLDMCLPQHRGSGWMKASWAATKSLGFDIVTRESLGCGQCYDIGRVLGAVVASLENSWWEQSHYIIDNQTVWKKRHSEVFSAHWWNRELDGQRSLPLVLQLLRGEVRMPTQS